MRKVFNFNLPDSKKFDVSISYPNFRKEGLGVLFSIIDWGMFLTLLVFMPLLFVPGAFGLVDYSERGFLLWVYSFVAILFGMQLLRVLLGGLTYYPKTYFDIPVLVFVASIVVSILFSNSSFDLVVGEPGLRVLSGFSHLAFLLAYYLLVSESLISGSKTKILFFVFLSLLTFYILNFGRILGDEAVLFVQPVPVFLFVLFFGRNILLKIISGLSLFLIVFNLDLSDFSLAFAFLFSFVVTAIVYFVLNAKTVSSSFDIFLENIVRYIKPKKVQLSAFIKSSGKLMLFVFIYMALFSLSIIKSVQSYNNDFTNLALSFNRSFNRMDSIRDWVFGTGLARPTDSFYSDILSSFGLVALTGLLLLAAAVLFALARLLRRKNIENKPVIYGLFSMFVGFLIFGLFQSFSPFAYLFFWMLVLLAGGYASHGLRGARVIKDRLLSFNGAKYKELLKEARAILIVSVIVAVIIMLAWLKANI